jgi:hypothetical protein
MDGVFTFVVTLILNLFSIQDYVNTLATIKQENGEKYLILKKKYFPEFYSSPYASADNAYNSSLPDQNYNSVVLDPPPPSSAAYPSYLSPHGNGGGGGNSSPSLLDEVMAGFVPPSRTLARQLPSLPTHYASSSPPPVSLPPPPAAAAWAPQPVGLPVPSGPPSYSQPQYQYAGRSPSYPSDLGLPQPPPSLSAAASASGPVLCIRIGSFRIGYRKSSNPDPTLQQL